MDWYLKIIVDGLEPHEFQLRPVVKFMDETERNKEIEYWPYYWKHWKHSTDLKDVVVYQDNMVRIKTEDGFIYFIQLQRKVGYEIGLSIPDRFPSICEVDKHCQGLGCGYNYELDVYTISVRVD